MKRFVKVCAVLGVVFLVLGTGITAGAAAMGADWSWILRQAGMVERYMEDDYVEIPDMPDMPDLPDMPDMPDMPDVQDGDWTSGGGRDLWAFDETGPSTSYSDVRKLDVQMKAGNVRIEKGGDDHMITVIYGDDGDCYQSYMEGRTLKIRCSGAADLKRRNDQNLSPRMIKILVPEGYEFDEVEAEMDAGEMTIMSVNTAKLELDISAGTVYVREGTVTSVLKAESKAGTVDFYGALSGKGDLECKAGNIYLDLAGDQNDYDYNIESSIGEVKIGTATFSGVKFDKTVDNGADYKINMECNMGNISLAFHQ